ncbi:hypothetical protein [uncultured Limnobacter sp.]|uniref:hypothetical protein n=1 Tax=uncultured Limnobacter sp. TaxID=199681 RepID=UPI0030F68999
MEIRKSEPMQTRPCKYCLAFQDDSVFADFNINQAGCLYLVRISFDGYCCCTPEIGIGVIETKSSKILISAIESNNLNSPQASDILRSYFLANKDFIWEDSLLEHKLI